jgi:polysaccharide biosynthesis/export protein
MKNEFKYAFQVAIIVFIAIATISCVPVGRLKYFNDLNNLGEPIVNPREQKLIMPFDYIYIRVFSIDEKTNLLFNSNANLPTNSSASMIGYLVDESGDINFPFTGKVKVGGLTPEQAGLKLEKALSEYVSNAAISVKFIESKVTVMGEVQNQGVYSFSQDKLNIYEALALGGGISRYGNRKSVVLIRQEGDKVMHHKLNLSDSKIAGKEYYYIQSNDVIVVEPLKSSTWYNFNNATFTTFLSSITTILTVYTLFLLK